MKTNLNRTISTQEEAEAFLSELHENNEVFNPDDSAHDVLWETCPQPTAQECDQLNVLMNDCLNVGDGGFDAHGYLIDLDAEDER